MNNEKVITLKLKHFKEFERYVHEYIDMFGLTQYQLVVEFEEDILARYASAVTSESWIVIKLNTKISADAYNDMNLRKTALHEVMHAVLEDYMRNFFNANDRIIVEEQMVVRFTNAILNRSK